MVGDFDSALTERGGIEQPAQVSPYLQRRRSRTFSVDDYEKGIRRGDRVILSRAITLIESLNPQHQAVAQQVIERCLPFSGNSLRIGITGVPGVGGEEHLHRGFRQVPDFPRQANCCARH